MCSGIEWLLPIRIAHSEIFIKIFRIFKEMDPYLLAATAYIRDSPNSVATPPPRALIRTWMRIKGFCLRLGAYLSERR